VLTVSIPKSNALNCQTGLLLPFPEPRLLPSGASGWNVLLLARFFLIVSNPPFLSPTFFFLNVRFLLLRARPVSEDDSARASWPAEHLSRFFRSTNCPVEVSILPESLLYGDSPNFFRRSPSFRVFSFPVLLSGSKISPAP